MKTLSWIVLLLSCSQVLPNAIPLEAAFQGRCENGHPCDQNCFNIHNGMYECDCNEGYVLLANGYNCRRINGTQGRPYSSLSSAEDIPPNGEGKRRKTSSNSSIAIQIEVDIDPPRSSPNDLSEDEMKSLGLPSHHVHYTSSSIEAPVIEELLEPGDIQVTYENEDRKDEEISGLYEDKVFRVDAYCNLDCGGGSCFMERIKNPQESEDFIMKRCLCPLGKTGEKCQIDVEIIAPSFSGHSYLTLPVLTNAYSDLQLSMEFRPKLDQGILLLTGENEDMTGDYLALVIIDRHIELRLDCGTGPGVVRTSAQVHLNRWNKLTVYRHDWGVWVQLNDGEHEQGRSQGLFSRITFAEPVILGGAGSFRNYGPYLSVNNGFSGCIKRLEINNKVYDFRSKALGGDSRSGSDITECPDDNCLLIPCHHNGRCLPLESGNNICQCPLGFAGEFCEKALDVKVPSFNGTSYLMYPGLGDSSPLWTEIELVFKAAADDGLILYNGQKNDGTDDFMAILMSRRYVEFAYDLGDGITVVRSESPILLNKWYTVFVSRTGRLAEMAITLGGKDNPLEMPMSRRVSNGAFSQLTLEQNLYLGGVPTFDLVSAYLPIRQSFYGCIQKLSINDIEKDLINSALFGLDVSSCEHPCNSKPSLDTALPCGVHGICKPSLDEYECECPLGLAGESCQDVLKDERTPIPSFNGKSFLHFKNKKIAKNLLGHSNAINMRIKIRSSNGLLFWVGSGGNLKSEIMGDFIALGISDGILVLKYNLGSGEGFISYNDTRINDEKWHRIRFTRTERVATLRVDNGRFLTTSSPGKLRQLNANGEVYIGGMNNMKSLPVKSFRTGIVGCVAELSIGKIYSINLLDEAVSDDGLKIVLSPNVETLLVVTYEKILKKK